MLIKSFPWRKHRHFRDGQKREYPCEFDGCTKSYSTTHGRRQHYRREHKASWDAKQKQKTPKKSKVLKVLQRAVDNPWHGGLYLDAGAGKLASDEPEHQCTSPSNPQYALPIVHLPPQADPLLDERVHMSASCPNFNGYTSALLKPDISGPIPEELPLPVRRHSTATPNRHPSKYSVKQALSDGHDGCSWLLNGAVQDFLSSTRQSMQSNNERTRIAQDESQALSVLSRQRLYDLVHGETASAVQLGARHGEVWNEAASQGLSHVAPALFPATAANGATRRLCHHDGSDQCRALSSMSDPQFSRALPLPSVPYTLSAASALSSSELWGRVHCARLHSSSAATNAGRLGIRHSWAQPSAAVVWESFESPETDLQFSSATGVDSCGAVPQTTWVSDSARYCGAHGYREAGFAVANEQHGAAVTTMASSSTWRAAADQWTQELALAATPASRSLSPPLGICTPLLGNDLSVTGDASHRCTPSWPPEPRQEEMCGCGTHHRVLEDSPNRNLCTSSFQEPVSSPCASDSHVCMLPRNQQ